VSESAELPGEDSDLNEKQTHGPLWRDDSPSTQHGGGGRESRQRLKQRATAQTPRNTSQENPTPGLCRWISFDMGLVTSGGKTTMVPTDPEGHGTRAYSSRAGDQWMLRSSTVPAAFSIFFMSERSWSS